MKIALLLIAVAFATARFVLPFESVIDRGDIFKDFAHLFVGGLFGAGLCTREWWPGAYHEYGWLEWIHNRRWFYLNLGITMTVLEVVAFKFHQR